MIILVFLTLIIVYLSLKVALIALRNYRAHQFFKKRAPGLPVVPNSNLFAGHLCNVALLHKNWKIMDDLHNKYGKSYGYYYGEQPWIATKDIELLKLVELDQGHKHLNRGQFHFPIKEMNDSIMQSNDEVWRRSRRAIAPALTNHKVCSDEVSDDLKAVIQQVKESLEKKLRVAEEKSGKRSIIMNVDDLTQRLALAVIFSIGYKQDGIVDFDAEEDTWLRWINDGLSGTTHPLTYIGIMFPFLRPLIHKIAMLHAVGKLRAKVIDFLVKIIEINRDARLKHAAEQKKISAETGAKEISFSDVTARGNFKRRMVDTIIDAYMDKKITYEDLIGNMWALLMAGFITTADAITCLVWHLALRPEIQEKLRQSIVKEGIESEYLMWCILESVRWHPPVPLGAGRILSEDIELNGQVYPAGAYVIPTVRSIHRDESIWPEAYKFKPERWSDKRNFHPAAFMGFGLGPRNCPGGKLAIHEIKLTMEMLLMNYRFEKCKETTSEFNFSSPIFIHNTVDQPIKVRLVSLD